jgi:histidinol-phosphate aminotransferase
MSISRRNLLRTLGAGAIASASAALPAFAAGLSNTVQTAPVRQPAAPVRLDKNENAYGPSPAALAAIKEGLSDVNRYPDIAGRLREKIAGLHKVKSEQVVLGCGSSEILRMAADAFLVTGKKLMLATPGYPLLQFYARNKGVEVVAVPLTRERAHDVKAMLARVDSSTGLVYICNPNNPTGSVTTRQDLEDFLGKLPPEVPVVIDEAYHHYVGATSSYASFIDRPLEGKPIIVARSFSKIYGLAGLRIGYAVAPVKLAEKIYQNFLQFGENLLGLRAALAALDDHDHVRMSARFTADAREEFYNHANVRMLGVSDSQTNFVLLQVDHPAEEVLEHFRKNSVLLGWRIPELNNFVRVSMGRPADMKEFWRVWDLLPHQMPQH